MDMADLIDIATLVHDWMTWAEKNGYNDMFSHLLHAYEDIHLAADSKDRQDEKGASR